MLAIALQEMGRMLSASQRTEIADAVQGRTCALLGDHASPDEWRALDGELASFIGALLAGDR